MNVNIYDYQGGGYFHNLCVVACLCRYDHNLETIDRGGG